MGWSSGTNIAQEFEDIILKYVPKKEQKKVAKSVLKLLESQDWDCISEVDIFYLIDLIENKADYYYDVDGYDDYRKELREVKAKLKAKQTK